MPWLIVFALAAAAVFVRPSHAATIPMQLPVNVVAQGGAYAGGGAASYAGGVMASGVGATVGGRAVTVPINWRIGVGAGRIAANAVRLNPIGLGIGVVANWLLDYGIQKCNDGTWCTKPTNEQAPNGKPYPNVGHWNVSGIQATNSESAQGACELHAAYSSTASFLYAVESVEPSGSDGRSAWCNYRRTAIPSGQVQYLTHLFGAQKVNGCASGHTLDQVTGMCIPPGYVPGNTSVPATDADWAKVPANGLPDGVANVLTQERGLIPLSPEPSTLPVKVELSQRYTDPVTGKQYVDMGYVTVTGPDVTKGDLQVVRQEVDSTGKPVADPNTGQDKPPEATKNDCAGSTKIGCMEAGDIPEGPNLKENEINVNITPDTGWGADTAACPADVVVAMRTPGAQPAVFSYQPVCRAADMFRPIVIGLAWVAAVLIALGVSRRGD